MGAGFATALHEITLVLFTTLAPAAGGACCILDLILCIAPPFGRERERLARALILPLAFIMVGIIASATHLGTPENALYVMWGIGRSPLSNEVALTVALLASSGFAWLYAYSEHPKASLARTWYGLNSLLALGMIAGISFAYSTTTIVTWNTWHATALIWLNGGSGGVLLALLTLKLARVTEPHRTTPLHHPSVKLLVAGAVCHTAGIVVLAMQWRTISPMSNALRTVADLAPIYPALICVYALFGYVAYAISCQALLKPTVGTPTRRRASRRIGAAVALYLVGTFAMRFGFYMIHMTVGISL